MHRQLDPARLGDHVDRLYRAALAFCGSREDAEDLVQETYARVLSRPRLLRAEGDLGYLLSVMRNTFLNRLRTQSRRVQAAPLSDDAEPAEERGWADPEGAYGARQVYETIAGLPEEFRDVIVAVDLVGLSYKEAAASLGLAEGTVMSRLYRARRQVVRQIDGADED